MYQTKLLVNLSWLKSFANSVDPALGDLPNGDRATTGSEGARSASES